MNIDEQKQEWLESFADNIRSALHEYGYEEQEGDEGEDDIVRSLISLCEANKERVAALEKVVEKGRSIKRDAGPVEWLEFERAYAALDEFEWRSDGQ